MDQHSTFNFILVSFCIGTNKTNIYHLDPVDVIISIGPTTHHHRIHFIIKGAYRPSFRSKSHWTISRVVLDKIKYKNLLDTKKKRLDKNWHAKSHGFLQNLTRHATKHKLLVKGLMFKCVKKKYLNKQHNNI